MWERSTHKVVRIVEDAVWPSRTNFHLRAAELMKKPGGAPRIAEFAKGTEGRAFWEGEFDLLGVITEERGGDFRIGSHGISTEGGGVITEGETEIIDGCESELSVCGGDRLRLIYGGRRGWLRFRIRGN